MSDRSPRIVCRASFTDAAIRDALRTGVIATRSGEWVVDPWDDEWQRAVDLLPAISAEGQDHILEVGRVAAVELRHARPASRWATAVVTGEIFLGVWPLPSISVERRDDPPLALERWPGTTADLLDLAAEMERRLAAHVEGLAGELVARTQSWLDELDPRARVQTDQIDRWVEEYEATVSGRTRVQLRTASQRAKAALDRLVTAAGGAASSWTPVGDGAVPPRVWASGVERLIEIDRAVQEAIGDLLNVLEVADGEAQARELSTRAVEEATRWIETNGSARLRKAVEMDVLAVSMGAYRDERLAHVDARWLWLPDGDAAHLRNPVNPSESALDLLAEARATIDPEARLCFHAKGKALVLIATLLDRKIWRPAMDWADDDEIEMVIRRRGRSLGPAEFIAASMDEEPF